MSALVDGVSALVKPRTFTSTQVCDLTGLSYRQVDYWCRTGLLHPQGGIGSGSSRSFSEEEVRNALVAAWMLGQGMPLAKVRDLLARGRMVRLVEVPLPPLVEALADLRGVTAQTLADDLGRWSR